MKNKDIVSQSFKCFLDKEFQLTESQLKKVQTPSEIIGLVSFVVNYKLPVL